MNTVRTTLVGTLALAGFAALVQPASAQTAQYTGAQAATYSGSNFSISGNTVTAQQTGVAGTLNFGGGAIDLLGINGLWVVGPTGDTIAGVTPTTGGPVGDPSGWTAETTAPGANPDVPGFGGHPGYGNGGGSDWITLAPTAEVIADHGNASPYTSGVFNFTGLSSATNYDLGVDYLLANGQTGRAYFSVTPTPPPPSAVPEPSALALLGLGALPLGLVARRRAGRA